MATAVASSGATKSVQLLPVYAHVSGSMGSGKTTFGFWLREQFPSVVVLDLDGFLSAEDVKLIQEMARDLNCVDTEVHQVLWEMFFLIRVNQGIETIYQDNPAAIIVLCGTFVRGSPDPFCIPDASKSAQRRFFLQPPRPTLLEQYYRRVAQMLEDDQLCQDLVQRNAWSILGSEQVKRMNQMELWVHCQQGYAVVNLDALRDAFLKDPRLWPYKTLKTGLGPSENFVNHLPLFLRKAWI
jgi:hypothetical protein